MTEQTKTFVSNLGETAVKLPESLIQQAKDALQATKLPTTRDEAWKYTRVAKIGKIDFKNESTELDSIEQFKIAKDVPTLVFINGHFSNEHSTTDLPEGVEYSLLSTSSDVQSTLPVEGEIFNAINTAHLVDGVSIHINKKAVIEETIQVLHILDGKEIISNFKSIIHAEDFSQANLIQGFFATEDTDRSFANISTEVYVGNNAHLTIDKVQFENETTFHINTERVNQQKDATFTINTITLNGGLVRNNLNIEVNGENSTSNLNGIYVLKGNQHVDNHTVVDHKVANCDSNELYKGVMDDKSTGVFNGKVYVRKDAQKINAFQSNRNVILNDSAAINSKPELEIYADDVKCSHGSTTGQLDEDSIFYLQARGLSRKSATQLLVSAFIVEVIDNIANEDVQKYTFKLLQERFGWDVNPEDFD